MKKKYLDINSEPALMNAGKKFKLDPSELKVDKRLEDERENIEAIRDSVHSEPVFCQENTGILFGQWLKNQKNRTDDGKIIAITLIGGILGGLFAVFGAFVGFEATPVIGLYLIVVGPIVEEVLKPSALFYLLEKKPYLIKWSWQFIIIAIISALTFAFIENLLYQFVYLFHVKKEHLSIIVRFRWIICTLLHVCTTMIASMGLRRVWLKQLEDGKPAEFKIAFPYFITAIVIHGLYNTFAMFWGNLLR